MQPPPRLVAHATLDRAFQAVVRSGPLRPAVSHRGGEVSYGELDRRAHRIATALVRRGVDLSAPVALVLGTGPSTVAAMLGVLRAGGFFVGIDPRYPAARNARIVTDMAPGALVTGAEHRGHAEAIAPAVPLIDLDVHQDGAPAPLPEIGDARRLAALVYTSGSTGRPKGVVYDHAALLHNAQKYVAAFAVKPGDRVSAIFPVNVYAVLRDVFVGLLSGATVCLYDLNSEGLSRFGEWVESERLTVLSANATVTRGAVEVLSPDHVQTVRLLKVGGERSYWSDIARLRHVFPDSCRYYCGFGASETTGLCHEFVEPGAPLGVGALPAGRPVEGMDVRVAGPDGTPLPDGEVGEITVRSRYIARGYWRQTSPAFTVDPAAPDHRTFSSGDLGRFLPDGRLEHHGRIDDRVKILGHRVSLWEVEQALLTCDGVREAAVVAVDPGGPRLVAHVRVGRGYETTPRALRDHLAAQVPPHMVPASVVLHDHLPRLATGKVDRSSLSAWETRRPGPAVAALEGAVERRLAQIWQDVLNAGPIGRDDAFLDVGGDSLRAMRVAAAVDREWGVALSVRDLFEAPSLADLAFRIEEGTPPREAALVAALSSLPAAEALALVASYDAPPPLS